MILSILLTETTRSTLKQELPMQGVFVAGLLEVLINTITFIPLSYIELY